MSVACTIKTCGALLLVNLLCAVTLAQDSTGQQHNQAAGFAALDAVVGKALFERVWVTAPASTRSADGLGPHYNARTCAACHSGGGGGSGVEQLNFVIRDPVYGELLQVQAIAGLPAEARLTLVEESVATVMFADGQEVELRKPVAHFTEFQHGTLQSAVSIRRAPSLRGLALLEQVSLQQLETFSDPDDRDADGISGRLAPGIDADGAPQAGRFGWKATAVSLEEQVSRALSLDIGLGTPRFPAAAGDCTAAQLRCQQAAGPFDAEPEVSAQMVRLLLTYIAALNPRSGQHNGPLDEKQGRKHDGTSATGSPDKKHDGTGATGSPDSEAGPGTFARLGCIQCHVPQLAGPDGPLQAWTDLLLHDMGPDLADPLPGAVATAEEWRTAPLWGLAEAGRWLHDGRAASLEEAILWHGGEAAASATAFRELNQADRERLLAWLRTL